MTVINILVDLHRPPGSLQGSLESLGLLLTDILLNHLWHCLHKLLGLHVGEGRGGEGRGGEGRGGKGMEWNGMEWNGGRKERTKFRGQSVLIPKCHPLYKVVSMTPSSTAPVICLTCTRFIPSMSSLTSLMSLILVSVENFTSFTVNSVCCSSWFSSA